MALNQHRRLRAETVDMTVQVPSKDAAGAETLARHPLSVSLAYDDAGALREVAFVGRGRIGGGVDFLLHDLGIRLSRAIQGRSPDTGEALP